MSYYYSDGTNSGVLYWNMSNLVDSGSSSGTQAQSLSYTIAFQIPHNFSSSSVYAFVSQSSEDFVDTMNLTSSSTPAIGVLLESIV